MAAAAVAVGAAAFLAYGAGFPNTDASWTLVWGRELLHLDAPSFAEGATPHPLTNLLGVIAAAVHPASETLLLVVGYMAVGALVIGAFALGRALFGVGRRPCSPRCCCSRATRCCSTARSRTST